MNKREELEGHWTVTGGMSGLIIPPPEQLGHGEAVNALPASATRCGT